MTGRHSPEPRPPPSRWWIAAGIAAVVTASGAAMWLGDAISVPDPPAAASPTRSTAPSTTPWPTPAPIFTHDLTPPSWPEVTDEGKQPAPPAPRTIRRAEAARTTPSSSTPPTTSPPTDTPTPEVPEVTPTPTPTPTETADAAEPVVPTPTVTDISETPAVTTEVVGGE